MIVSRRGFLKTAAAVMLTVAIDATTLAYAAGENTSRFVTSKEKPKVAPVAQNKAPNRITSTIKGDPRIQRAFLWFSSASEDNAVVLLSEFEDMRDAKTIKTRMNTVDSHYLERDAEGFLIYRHYAKEAGGEKVIDYFTDKEIKEVGWDPESEAKRTGHEVGIDVTKVKEYTYSAEATGLKPATRYYYQVGVVDGELSAVGTFVTAAEKDQPFSFIQYTDTQNAYWNEHIRNEAQFSADTLKQAQSQAKDAAFVLHTGDIVETAEAEDEWVDLMKQSQDGLLKMSLVPVPGNHDEYGINEKNLFPRKFNEHFNVDSAGEIDGGSYYSYDYHNAHFVVLNTNDYKNPEKKALGKEQLAWIRKDVNEARARGMDWIIVAYHKPLFSKSYHSLQDQDVQNVREDFMSLLDELEVDLALQGHDHVYSRTKSLLFAETAESFANAKIDYADFAYDQEGYSILKKPKGTTFVIPNTGGTKAYDALFNKSLEHIKKVRPKLNWLTQQQLEHYNSLFEIGFQPDNSDRFKTSHENYRDSSEQNFAVYEVDGKKLTGSIYQVSGDLSKGEPRRVRLIDRFHIEK